MDDLIRYLKSLVMATTLIDKKYRETVPQIVSEAKTLVGSSDECESKRKKKKPRKMKLGKDGLYPAEDYHIRRWWNTYKPELHDDEVVAKPEEVKYHISCLRTRETQLQVILILEILALEKLRPAEDTMESQLPGMEVKTPTKPALAETVPKRRDKHNFPVLVDLHVDRLCIWQTTTLDEVKSLAESQRHGQEMHESGKANCDPLSDFCVDIIIPL